MHHRRPVVQIAVCVHIAGTVVRIVTARGSLRSGGGGAKRYYGTVGIVCGAEVLAHPALVANLHSVIDIAVDIGDSSVVRAGLCIASGNSQRGERHFLPIACPRIVGCVGPQIVGRARCQVGQFAGESTRPVSVCREEIIYCRIRRGAPAHAPGSHVGTACSIHVAAGSGCGNADIAGRIRSHRRDGNSHAVAKYTTDRDTIRLLIGVIIGACTTRRNNKAFRAQRTVFSRSPEISIVTKISVIPIVHSGWKCGESRCVVATHIISGCIIITAGIPRTSGRQRLGNVGTVTVEGILTLTSHVINQLIPFGLRRYAPACWANTTYAYSILTGHRYFMRQRGPVIKITVCGHIGRAVVRIITIGHRVGSDSPKWYG